MCAAFSRTAAAQDAADPWKEARFHFGPVALAPTINILNVGVDTNVFAAAENPERDWTAMFVPGTRLVLRLGSARLTTLGEMTYQYFKKFESERSLNGRGSAQLDVPLNRLRLSAAAYTSNSRLRQGAEITSRVRRLEEGFTAGATVRVAGQTRLGVAANRQRVAFPDDAVFLNTNLQQVLGRDEDRASLVLTTALTPLTTFRVVAEAQQDRFKYSPDRDASSVRAVAGFDLDTRALLRGTALVGYQQFKPRAGTPPFEGVVASSDISSVVRGSTQFRVRFDRAPTYSFDVKEPYYLLTSLAGEAAQQVFGNFEVLAIAGRQQLHYRRLLTSAGDDGLGRRDRSFNYGGGLAYRFSRTGRIRVNVDASERQSQLAERAFKSVQVTNSLEYAF